jgi:hypothetical protein
MFQVNSVFLLKTNSRGLRISRAVFLFSHTTSCLVVLNLLTIHLRILFSQESKLYHLTDATGEKPLAQDCLLAKFKAPKKLGKFPILTSSFLLNCEF